MASNTSSLDGEITASSEILWLEILSRIPFVKTDNSMATSGSEHISGKSENKVRIDSKNEVEKEDALQLEQWIHNQEVLLSHTCTMQPLQYCRGIVEDFEYQEKNIKVIVSSASDFPIWEDTDIWMVSTLNSSFCNMTEPNTSIADELGPIQEKVDLNEMSQEELFRSINGWKLVERRGYRKRMKFGDKWKNVYCTELVMTPVEPMKMDLLRYVKERTSLMFSDDIDEQGDVLLDVIEINIEEGKLFTIMLGITGFTRTGVNVPLIRDKTYFLNIYDGEYDDIGSCASEPGVLPGYPLRQNIDELCEKIGKLTITDVCIKTWQDPNGNIPYIRLVVTSQRKMKNFQLLTGHHIVIQSEYCRRSSIMAVVSKVMNGEMIITLKGIQKEGNFYLSPTQMITIQIYERYEEQLQKLSGEDGVVEDLRQQIISRELDILMHRVVPQDIPGQGRKYFAAFTSQNEAFSKIPINTRVLLGKSWELENRKEEKKKADFVFAVRVDDSMCEFKPKENDHKVTFEIIHSRNLVEDAPKFMLTKAFYFVDFDSHRQISDNSIYCLMDARLPQNDTKSHPHRTVQFASKMQSISKNLKFLAFPLRLSKPVSLALTSSSISSQAEEKKKAWRPKSNNLKLFNNNNDISSIPEEKEQEVEVSTPKRQEDKTDKTPKTPEKKKTDVNYASKVEKNSTKSPRKGVKPPDWHSECSITSKEPWKTYGHIDEKHKQLCYVFITRAKNLGEGGVVKLQMGLNESGNQDKSVKAELGSQLAFTSGTESTEIVFNGVVFDTKKISERSHPSGRQGDFEHRFPDERVETSEENEGRAASML